MAEKTYYAADPDVAKAVAAFDERIGDYYTHIATDFLPLWRAARKASFQGFFDGGEIGRVGKQGEFRTISVNEVGNLRQHLLNMITAQRPAFEARSESADSVSQQQAPVGVAVTEMALRDKGLEDRAKEAADTMLRAGESFILKRWDTTTGPIFSSEPEVDKDGQPKIGPDGQPLTRPVHAGDVAYSTLHPLDVPREDFTKPAGDQRWFAPRRRVNRYDLAAQFPDLEEPILDAPSVVEDFKRPFLVDYANAHIKRDNIDDVWVYDVLVEKAPATPEGRLLSYVTPECILFDGPMPHREFPLYRMAAQDLEGTCFGYTLLWDLLAPQIALNNVASQITTLAAELGAVVWEPDGKGLTPSKIRGVLTLLKGGTVAPQVLDLMKIPGELFKLVEFYLSALERLSGVNSIYRGQAEEGQKGLSGAAYALFASRAIEFGSRMQGAYNGALEKVATGTIYDYQDMGNGEYLLSLAGEGNQYRVESFLAGRQPEADPTNPQAQQQGGAPRIDKVARMVVKTSNPLQSTTAGRMQLFESLMQVPGAIKTPAEAIQVVTTGKLDPATQSTQRELENVQKENERLSKGEPVVALITDRPWVHIPEHAGVASSPEFRDMPNSPAAQAFTAHVEQHVEQMRSVDPLILAIQGCPPEILQMLAMTQQPPPPGPGGPPPGPGGSPDGGPPMDPGAAEVPGQPRMPINPLTQERMPGPEAAA